MRTLDIYDWRDLGSQLNNEILRRLNKASIDFIWDNGRLTTRGELYELLESELDNQLGTSTYFFQIK
jgi:hypothetical protein